VIFNIILFEISFIVVEKLERFQKFKVNESSWKFVHLASFVNSFSHVDTIEVFFFIDIVSKVITFSLIIGVVSRFWNWNLLLLSFLWLSSVGRVGSVSRIS